MRTLINLFIFGAGILWMQPPAEAQCGSCCCSTGPNKQAVEKLTEAEIKDLRFMYEEEKLARDVYNAMYELYEQRVFSNIPRAEQFHMNAILGLLEANGLKGSAGKPGRFANKELQKLYDSLVQRGSISKQEAYLVGAWVEEVDIKDLQDAAARTENEAIQAVYKNLIGGSKRHLNAFARNYEAVSGKAYTAQKMDQAAVNEILGR